MNNFDYARVSDVAEAVKLKAETPDAKFIAGGTNLIDLMKYHVEQPRRLIDISRLPLNVVWVFSRKCLPPMSRMCMDWIFNTGLAYTWVKSIEGTTTSMVRA